MAPHLRHDALVEPGGQGDRGAVQGRYPAERLLRFRSQLGRQIGKHELTIEQPLHQRVVFRLHANSFNSARSRSYARCIRILRDGTDAPVRAAISS